MRNQLTPDIYDYAKLKFGFKRHDKISETWYYFRDYGFTFMAPTKCGSASIRQFIWMNEIEDRMTVQRRDQVRGTAYVAARHPIDRFCSLWRSKCRDKRNLKDKRVYGFTPERLMSHIEEGNKDLHWTPQVTLLGEVEATIIPLAMLGYWWKQSGIGELGKFNTSEGAVDIDDSLKERILTFYADDVILHNKAESDFCMDSIPNIKPQLKQ